jgi:small subunit ribosomal protein S17e
LEVASILLRDGGRKIVSDWRNLFSLGKVKTEYIKRLAKKLMESFPEKFSRDFDANKHTVDKLTEGATTKVRNQVAGYITHTITINEPDFPNKTEEKLVA